MTLMNTDLHSVAELHPKPESIAEERKGRRGKPKPTTDPWEARIGHTGETDQLPDFMNIKCDDGF